MINTLYHITPYNSAYVYLHWNAASDTDVSYIFANGKMVAGAIMSNMKSRSVRVPMAATAAIEIHDMPDSETIPAAIYDAPQTRPLLIWNAVKRAVAYRIYLKSGSGTEIKIYDRAALDGLVQYEITCPRVLAGNTWHHIRVEAVDEYGNESTRAAWNYFAHDLPAAPSGLTAMEGSEAGKYNITITP